MVAIWQAIGLIPWDGDHYLEGSIALLLFAIIFLVLARSLNGPGKNEQDE